MILWVYPAIGLAFAWWALRAQLRRIHADAAAGRNVTPDDYAAGCAVAWSAGVFWPAVALVAAPVWLILRYERWRGVHGRPVQRRG